MNGKERTKRRQMHITENIMVVCVVCVVVAAIIVSQSNHIMQMFQTQTYESMEESGEKHAEIMALKLSTAKLMIENVATDISNQMIENKSHSIYDYIDDMKRYERQYDFQRIGICSVEGQMQTTDGFFLNVSDLEYFRLVMESGKSVITEPINSRIDGEVIYAIASPIKGKENNIVGILVGTLYMDDLQHLLFSENFNNEELFMVINQDGKRMVYSQDDEDMDANFIDSLLTSDENYKLGLRMLEDMKWKQSGSGWYVGESNQYICYQPIGINDWYFVTMVPENLLGEDFDAIASRLFMTTLISCILLAFMLFMMMQNDKRQEMRYDKAMNVDALTGGISFSRFCELGKAEMRKTKKNAAYCVLMIEKFHYLESIFGEKKGEELLQYIYWVIQDSKAQDDLVSRFIYDTYEILMFYDDKAELEMRINKLCNRIYNDNPLRFSEYMLRPILGVYRIEDEEHSFEEMHQYASFVIDDIINTDHGYYAYYDEKVPETVLKKEKLKKDIIKGLEEKEFFPVFQLKYDALTEKICGAEALVRWKKADGNMVYPNEFIPVAEESGLVVDLDKYMFTEVCRKQKMLLESGITPVPISVNLSRRALYNADVIREYKAIIGSFGIDTSLVQIEITESSVYEYPEKLQTMMEEFHASGFQILLDDFGTGYSSMMAIKSLHIDVLKLDKSFCDDYKDEKTKEIIACIINLAKVLRIHITAEGVENKEQFELLRELGCDTIQGFYFSKPVNSEEYDQKLAQHGL